MQPHSLPWTHPLALARSLRAQPMVLLYSGRQADYSGRYSLLACDAAEQIKSDTFAALEPCLSTGQPALENAWFGYLGYGLKHCIESLPADAPGLLRLPGLWMARFNRIFVFDHFMQSLTCHSDSVPSIPSLAERRKPEVSIASLASNMTKAEYLAGVSRVLNAIYNGDLYQANLTRKFFGRFSAAPDTFALFEALCDVSPSPYSAYMRFDDTAILSSSPERFLHVDAAGHASTRPIKGSAGRSEDPKTDEALRSRLANSAKDRAENLMIVDLMRNDLSRSCLIGSVRTDSLFDITSHATVHHMSSTVSGQKRPNASSLELVKGCFPPGSMTGAPKIRAMQLCTELEKLERGVYSGALGWFGGDGSLDLSVVIRTLIIQGENFEFQVGGGIVADSTPEAELEETLIKAAAIAKVLKIPAEGLKNL